MHATKDMVESETSTVYSILVQVHNPLPSRPTIVDSIEIRSETRIKEIQPQTPALEIYRFTLQCLFHSKICQFIASPMIRVACQDRFDRLIGPTDPLTRSKESKGIVVTSSVEVSVWAGLELVTGSGISGEEEGGVDAMFATTIHLRRKGLSRSQGRTRLYDTIFGFEIETFH
ncbi:hypothetical protein TSUD_165020 [Trifolium subterraneum]|uniref:Uncharacterized protein n=1 Tax=Trifolium subterraneum TaxID=3900 RepID=A0A2Z6P225_TRISU|nr:hypothetical protein TSUD_165020 [Trifolium subterraneum]